MMHLFWVRIEKLLRRKWNLAHPLTIDLVFAMDCTGSMASYIDSAKTNIRAIVEDIVRSEQSDIRLALVEYRDHPPQVSVCSF